MEAPAADRVKRENWPRCSWPATELDIAYHDREWGVPVHDDRVLFEFLTLEGAQAGLSWSTILNKREGYRRAFADFDPGAVARFSRRKVDRLLADQRIGARLDIEIEQVGSGFVTGGHARA